MATIEELEAVVIGGSTRGPIAASLLSPLGHPGVLVEKGGG